MNNTKQKEWIKAYQSDEAFREYSKLSAEDQDMVEFHDFSLGFYKAKSKYCLLSGFLWMLLILVAFCAFMALRSMDRMIDKESDRLLIDSQTEYLKEKNKNEILNQKRQY